jgi:hypothetical protein
MEYMMIEKPLKRLPGWVAVSDYPIQIGCYPKSVYADIETTPCFSMVKMKYNQPMRTALAVYNWMEL